MLDENLPTFLLKPSDEKPKQNSNFLFSQHGSTYEPTYSVRHLDPEQHSSKNRYAVGLYDAYVPDILYAEVLLIPEWTQPTLNAEEIRRNGGVPPPPEPLLPTEFAIQLYNPDQQIKVKYRPASFTKDAAWEFEMPQVTFREPSSSALDRSQDDPVASDLTPKIQLKWRKDSKFNKDLACYQSGNVVNPDGSKKRSKEPDITLAIFRALKEVTLYETNFSRVDIEDIKGFEVVLLLGAVVIRDVYFSPMKETFNLGPHRRLSDNGPLSQVTTTTMPISPVAPSGAHSPLTNLASASPRDGRVPPTDPRSQWEIEVESARLKQQAEAEKRAESIRLQAEERNIRKMLEAEEKQKRKEQAKIDHETERLRKLYGKEDASARPALPPRPAISSIDERRASSYHSSPLPQLQFPNAYSQQGGPSMTYMSGASSQPVLLDPLQTQQQRLKQKSSIFSFGRRRDDDPNRLAKKRSAVF